MINKAVVVLGTLAAAGAGWASHEYLYKDWTPPARSSVRGDFRRGGDAVPPAAADPDAPLPDAPAAPPKPGEKPGAQKPDASKPPVPAPPPAVPQPVVKIRKVTDVKLPVVLNGKALTLPKFREVHVDPENAMTWYGEGGKTMPYEGFANLGTDLRKYAGSGFVIVADENVSWSQIRQMLQTGQNNYAANAFLGVARKEEPEILRVLPLRQCERSDELMPEGDLFKILVESKSGPPVLSVDGQKLATFPADLAMAWNAWKTAHKDLTDTSVPEKTRVVVEAPRSASIAHMAQILDVLRGIGIETERLAGSLPTRPLR